MARGRAAHAVVVVTVVLHVVALTATGGAARTWVTLTASLVPTVAVASGWLRRRVDRSTWGWALAGLLVLVVHNVAGLVPDTGHGLVEGVRTYGMPTAYLLIMVAVVGLMLQANRYDLGTVVDAAIIALGTSLSVWVLVVDPLLDPDVTDGVRIRTMVLLVACGGIAGAASQAVVLLPHRRTSMLYVVTTLVASFAGVLARNLTVTPDQPRGAMWAPVLWVVAYATMAGSVLHPSVSAPPAPDRRPEPARGLSWARILLLGGALAVGPATALVQSFAPRTRTPTSVVAATTLVVVVLVVLRLGELARQHDRTQARLTHLADHDTLTGLPNRRAFRRHLEDLLARVEQREAPGVVVLLCDLDDFKDVNDRYGHRVGDELLRAAAARLAASVRTGGADDVVARLAGDEFVAALRADPSSAADAPERLRAAVERPVEVDDVVLHPRLSVGATTVGPGERVSVDQVMQGADEHMYADKRARRAAQDLPSPRSSPGQDLHGGSAPPI